MAVSVTRTPRGRYVEFYHSVSRQSGIRSAVDTCTSLAYTLRLARQPNLTCKAVSRVAEHNTTPGETYQQAPTSFQSVLAVLFLPTPSTLDPLRPCHLPHAPSNTSSPTWLPQKPILPSSSDRRIKSPQCRPSRKARGIRSHTPRTVRLSSTTTGESVREGGRGREEGEEG